MKTLKILAALALLAGCVPPEGAAPTDADPAAPPPPAVPVFEQSSDPLDVNLSAPPTLICDESLPRREQIAGCVRLEPREGVGNAPVLLPNMIATPAPSPA